MHAPAPLSVYYEHVLAWLVPAAEVKLKHVSETFSVSCASKDVLRLNKCTSSQEKKTELEVMSGVANPMCVCVCVCVCVYILYIYIYINIEVFHLSTNQSSFSIII